MNKLVAGAGGLLAAGVTVLGLAMAPTAAADETGPSSVACAEASVRVRDAAVDAVAAGDALAKANKELLANLQADLTAKEKIQAAKLEDLRDVLADPASDQADIDKARAELLAAQKDVQDAAKALKDAAPPSDLKDALTRAEVALERAIAAQTKACDFVLPTVTATPPPSVTVTVVPSPSPRLPSAIDTGYAA
jgi:septal ring factor EnvC (AmiA/AmiB activator)